MEDPRPNPTLMGSGLVDAYEFATRDNPNTEMSLNGQSQGRGDWVVLLSGSGNGMPRRDIQAPVIERAGPYYDPT